MEKRPREKKAMIDFLSTQIISKPPDLQKNKKSDNGEVNSKSNYDGFQLKNSSDDRTENLIIFVDSMLNNVNSRELSK